MKIPVNGVGWNWNHILYERLVFALEIKILDYLIFNFI